MPLCFLACQAREDAARLHMTMSLSKMHPTSLEALCFCTTAYKTEEHGRTNRPRIVLLGGQLELGALQVNAVVRTSGTI